LEDKQENLKLKIQIPNSNESLSHFQQPSSCSQEKGLSIKTPPYPEIFTLEKTIIFLYFDFLSKLKNVCVKIPLLQAIKDIPIFTLTIKELCLKNPGRKRKDPPILKAISLLAKLSLGKY
jgi:hypothetical protein